MRCNAPICTGFGLICPHVFKKGELTCPAVTPAPASSATPIDKKAEISRLENQLRLIEQEKEIQKLKDQL